MAQAVPAIRRSNRLHPRANADSSDSYSAPSHSQRRSSKRIRLDDLSPDSELVIPSSAFDVIMTGPHLDGDTTVANIDTAGDVAAFACDEDDDTGFGLSLNIDKKDINMSHEDDDENDGADIHPSAEDDNVRIHKR
ncbi:hypothetical protein EUX98_g2814 [Antrodiella citrinella]|uniref:Uncharacterized protein n=1 Tax=Antrodiella citrinella TaxID=2447956 RepID=A0A4S4N6D5_9APHY|nr:hypothetical protein EUX98_g2814 [Antrodiella citrinella]